MSHDSRLRSILAHNTGFDDPDRWIEYARNRGFKSIMAQNAPTCPGCGGAPRARWLGQYIYYSTLIRLKECAACGLVWSDALIDPSVVRQHFEAAYKDDEYFRVSRRAIFEHLCDVIAELSPIGGSVLDIGGARGDLMAELVARRPDLRVTVNDISRAATDHASHQFGFGTLTGDVDVLSAYTGRFDVVVLSDVLYYEPRISATWDALSRLVGDRGSVVIRVPNRYLLIRLGQMLYRMSRTSARSAMQDRVRFFNPEHVFVFRKPYLRRRLAEIGFTRVRALPSPTLKQERLGWAAPLLFKAAAFAHRLSGQRAVLTPAMVVVGTERRI